MNEGFRTIMNGKHPKTLRFKVAREWLHEASKAKAVTLADIGNPRFEHGNGLVPYWEACRITEVNARLASFANPLQPTLDCFGGE